MRAPRRFGKFLLDDPVVTQAEGFALDHESQTGVDGPHSRTLVLAEKTRVLVWIGG